MAKSKTQYVCQSCGASSVKWVGKCPDCGEWNSFVEETVQSEPLRKQGLSNHSDPKLIGDIISGDKERYDTGINELNRVLGGGLVKGSLTLISGDPGIDPGHDRRERFGAQGVQAGEGVHEAPVPLQPPH